MTEQMRNSLRPQEYIRQMYKETVNGELKVWYKSDDSDSFEVRIKFPVNWSAEDVEKIIQRYNFLTSALERIGRLHNKLKDEESIKELLSESDLEVYISYVRPYEPMEVNWDQVYPIPPCEPKELNTLIQAILERGRYGDLIEEEELLLNQYFMWREEQSQKRIPFNRRSCADLILRASRYEGLISSGALESIVTEEGRCLAEEMVLYYFGKEEPIVWE